MPNFTVSTKEQMKWDNRTIGAEISTMPKWRAVILAAALLQTAWAWEHEQGGDRWVPKDKEVLVDSVTGLQWTRRDNLSDIDWQGGARYCAGLPLAGGGWRLPTLAELVEAYTAGREGATPCGRYRCRMSPKFYLTSWWFWVDELQDASGAGPFSLHDGNRFTFTVSGGNVRALCVRRHP